MELACWGRTVLSSVVANRLSGIDNHVGATSAIFLAKPIYVALR